MSQQNDVTESVPQEVISGIGTEQSSEVNRIPYLWVFNVI